jgi:hypothetical protein
MEKNVSKTTTDGKVGASMSQREANMVWLKDTLEHLTACQQQLEWAEDPNTVHLLTDTMLRDLDCCRRLCETLRRRSHRYQPVA